MIFIGVTLHNGVAATVNITQVCTLEHRSHGHFLALSGGREVKLSDKSATIIQKALNNFNTAISSELLHSLSILAGHAIDNGKE